MSEIRRFETGATRDTSVGKFDYEGFLSPLVIEEFGRYMHDNRLLPDGTLRESDNWQLGIPLVAYAKSLWRHHVAFWKSHRGYPSEETIEQSLCAIIFNAQGYLHERLKSHSSRPAATFPFQEAVIYDATASLRLAEALDRADEDGPTSGLKAGEALNPVSQNTGD